MMANLLLCHIPVQNEIYIVSSYSTKCLIVLVHSQQHVHVCSSCSTLCEVELLNQSRCLTNKFLSTHADVRGPPKIFRCKMSSQDIQMQEVLPRYSEIVAGPAAGACSRENQQEEFTDEIGLRFLFLSVKRYNFASLATDYFL